MRSACSAPCLYSLRICWLPLFLSTSSPHGSYTAAQLSLGELALKGQDRQTAGKMRFVVEQLQRTQLQALEGAMPVQASCGASTLSSSTSALEGGEGMERDRSSTANAAGFRLRGLEVILATLTMALHPSKRKARASRQRAVRSSPPDRCKRCWSGYDDEDAEGPMYSEDEDEDGRGDADDEQRVTFEVSNLTTLGGTRLPLAQPSRGL